MGLASIPFRLDRSRNATVQVFEHLRELIAVSYTHLTLPTILLV